MIESPRFVCLLFALVTLVVYLPVRHHAFLTLDDPDYVSNNGIVQAGLSWSGVKWAFTTWHAANWHPLTWFSHMLDCDLFGLNAGAHLLVNVLFHIANTILLFLLLYRLTGAFWPGAFVAALLPGIHCTWSRWPGLPSERTSSAHFLVCSRCRHTDVMCKDHRKTKGRRPGQTYRIGVRAFDAGLLIIHSRSCFSRSV